MWNLPICDIFVLQRDSAPLTPHTHTSSQFPRFVGHPDLPMSKTLRVVGLLTVMILFQSKKFTACKIKDEKEETIFHFLMVLNQLKLTHPFESKNI